MDKFKKITVSVPSQLFELGLSESQVNGLVYRWFVISLYQQRKISATEAGELLSTGRDGFFKLLDTLGILYRDREKNTEVRVSPQLAKLSSAQKLIDTLREDLSQLKHKLFKLENELQEANRARTDFIATVSHELRTPLNSIIGFAKLLLNQKIGPLNEVQHTDVSVIYDSSKHLLSLVNDILDLTKIEAGKIRLDAEWVTVEEIIVGVIASTYILIENKPIELKEEYDPHLPRVFVDRGRIRQVVLNLLSNAAKFTDTGTITLRVSKIIDGDQEFVCFSVKDTGIGINKTDMEKVFEPFRQIDSSIARRAEGTGLGLPISYRLVKLHGGNLWATSTAGKGSTFSFTLPVKPVSTLTNAGHAEYRLG